MAVFSALLPFYASPCSAAFRWWRIALAPGFVEPLCCIASMPHARSPATHGFSLSLKHNNTCHKMATAQASPRQVNLSITQDGGMHDTVAERDRQSPRDYLSVATVAPAKPLPTTVDCPTPDFSTASASSSMQSSRNRYCSSEHATSSGGT